jgi:hypothetical protein
MAAFLNNSAVMVWHLCTGEMTVGDIKGLLKDSFPKSGTAIDEDVEAVLKMLSEHGAIRMS